MERRMWKPTLYYLNRGRGNTLRLAPMPLSGYFTSVWKQTVTAFLETWTLFVRWPHGNLGKHFVILTPVFFLSILWLYFSFICSFSLFRRRLGCVGQRRGQPSTHIYWQIGLQFSDNGYLTAVPRQPPFSVCVDFRQPRYFVLFICSFEFMCSWKKSVASTAGGPLFLGSGL
jgi:hypothetical protein